MSQTYKIHRWDTVIFSHKKLNPIPTPIIYIKCEENLIKFANDNSNTLLVKLNVPDTIYDNKRVIGIFGKSSEIPNCRPIFFENTQLYVIVLQAPWYGYPDYNGDVEVIGLTGYVPEKKLESIKFVEPQYEEPQYEEPQYEEPQYVEQFSDNVSPSNQEGGVSKNFNIPVSAVIGIFIAFIVLFVALILIIKK